MELADITAKQAWTTQQRAILRMHLFLIGETHRWLAEFSDTAQTAITRAANSEGKLDGLGLTQALSAIEREWGQSFKTWERLFQTLRREAASIPFGTWAVLHREALTPTPSAASPKGRGGLEEAEGKNSFDYVFNPQLQAVLDAANRRVYGDGLRLSQRLWRLEQESLTGIRNVLYAGVANGASAWDMAKALEAFLGPGRDCPRWTSTRLYKLTKGQIAAGVRTGLKSGAACAGQGVAYNALRLARNEVQIAHHMATDAIMGSIPWIEQEQIHLSPAHPEKDVCDDTIAGGEKGEGIYAKGTIQLPLHVQCLCYKTAVLMKPEAFSARLNGWTSGGGAWPEMDAYAAGLGGNVFVDLTGTLMAQALARWASENRDELLRVVKPGAVG